MIDGINYFLKNKPINNMTQTNLKGKLYFIFVMGLVCIYACPKSAMTLCNSTEQVMIEKFRVFKQDGTGYLVFKAKIAIDADGSPRAYGPNDTGLDELDNARTDGKWVGIVVDKYDKPFVQKTTDPFPGFYISPTALYDAKIARTDPRCYVNSETIPYYVLPQSLMDDYNMKVGDMGYVYNQKTQLGCFAILADIGPEGKLGEGSIALAQKIGLTNVSPRDGGIETPDIVYIAFPNSGMGEEKHRTIVEINQKGAEMLSRLDNNALNCFKKM
jgi:Fungal chitosanase of glycosyl hydrolase group 75